MLVDFKHYLATSASNSGLAPDILPTSTARSSLVIHESNIEPNLETKIPMSMKPMSSLSELTHRLSERRNHQT